MNRRRLLESLAALASTGLITNELRADQRCMPTPIGESCSAFIPLGKLDKSYAAQHMTEWCWAACISMLFGYNGHRVSQRRIVKEAYGTVGNMPANYATLMNSLNRDWKDDRGATFSVSTDHMYCPEAGDADLTNDEMIDRLRDESPILFCTAAHAMILTSMSFVQTQLGVQVTEAWVMDPWPGNGLRRLALPEMVPAAQGGQIRFVATVNVSDD